MVLEVLELKEELVVPALARVALPLEQACSLTHRELSLLVDCPSSLFVDSFNLYMFPYTM